MAAAVGGGGARNPSGLAACYIRGSEAPAGHWDVEVSHAGDIILFKESTLRTLPERIFVKRLPELLPVTGMPKPGATDVHFEFIRRD